jgi:hypothetical protein
LIPAHKPCPLIRWKHKIKLEHLLGQVATFTEPYKLCHYFSTLLYMLSIMGICPKLVYKLHLPMLPLKWDIPFNVQRISLLHCQTRCQPLRQELSFTLKCSETAHFTTRFQYMKNPLLQLNLIPSYQLKLWWVTNSNPDSTIHHAFESHLLNRSLSAHAKGSVKI